MIAQTRYTPQVPLGGSKMPVPERFSVHWRFFVHGILGGSRGDPAMG
jgi:hypothetical protein